MRLSSFCHLDDTHMLWFPKMANYRNGKYIAPARAKGWTNYLTDNGETFIEEKENDTRSGNADGDGGLPRYTFGYYEDKGYIFLGVFQAVKDKCRLGHFEFRKISDHIELEQYQSADIRAGPLVVFSH